jgi:hypothetical protein
VLEDPFDWHAARGILVWERQERRREIRARVVLRKLLLDLGQHVAYIRVDARAVWQRGHVVVVTPYTSSARQRSFSNPHCREPGL